MSKMLTNYAYCSYGIGFADLCMLESLGSGLEVVDGLDDVLQCEKLRLLIEFEQNDFLVQVVDLFLPFLELLALD